MSDTLSLPQELFLLANGFSVRNCVVQYRKTDRRHVSGGQGEAAGTVACISFVSAFSEVAGEEPQGNNLARQDFSEKNKQEEIRKGKENKVCGTNQTKVDQAVFNLEENSVSKPMVSDGSKRPRSFCNEDRKDPGEKQTASPAEKRGVRKLRKS
ncbi:hypothetical protein BDV11DRAFT_66907 [Aspergillus similis]